MTSLVASVWEARRLYEEFYWARGEMENRIKEQLMPFADRTSTALLRRKQIRLYFSSMAYTLVAALRRLGLQGTDLAQAATIRLKLLKIGALIRITVRRVGVSLASGYAYAELFAHAHAQLRASPLPISRRTGNRPRSPLIAILLRRPKCEKLCLCRAATKGLITSRFVKIHRPLTLALFKPQNRIPNPRDSPANQQFSLLVRYAG